MRDDTADKMANLVVTVLVFLLFGIFILAFKYPKVMIPLLAIVGVVIFIASR